MKYEEMVNELEEANRGTIKLKSKYHSKLQDYINCTNRIKDISFLLKEADQIRRKYNNDETKEKIEVLDADGRKKIILKEDAVEYLKLVEEKKNIVKEQQKLYKELLKMQSTKHDFSKVEEKVDSQNVREVENSIANENIETKSALTTNVERTKEENGFLSSAEDFRLKPIPNTENEASIAEIGVKPKEPTMREKFLEAAENFQLSPIFTENTEGMSRFITPNNNSYDYPEYHLSFDLPERLTLIDLNDYLERNKIKINPLVKVKFRNGIRVNLKKAWLCVKNKISLKKFKKIIPKAFNVDKYAELGAAKLYGKLLDSGICIRNAGLKFKDGVSQKYNSTKSYITNIPKRTKNYILDKYNDVKYYLEDKKKIRELKKVCITTKEAMEVVYGETKDKHLDYRIVNRVTNFKDNTCQRVNSMKSKIISVSKSVCDTIAKPFTYLRENVRDNVRREELQSKITMIRQQNLAKKRVLTNDNLSKTRSGYVGSIALITVSVIILSVIIFIGIGSLLGR